MDFFDRIFGKKELKHGNETYDAIVSKATGMAPPPKVSGPPSVVVTAKDRSDEAKRLAEKRARQHNMVNNQ